LTILSDHRADQTPVRNQGSRSACVGFAVAAAHEWMRPESLRSIEDVLWAAHQIGGDPNTESTSVQFALQGLQQHGHADEAAWPYGSPAFPAERPAEAKDPQNRAELAAWRRMPSLDLDTVANEIASGRAVVLTLGVVLKAWPKTGVVDAPAGRKTPGAHAVLAVGTTRMGSEVQVIIKNSWGVGWGVGGYGFISSRYLDSYVRAGHILEPACDLS
jgi:Papain family cysteine protease